MNCYLCDRMMLPHVSWRSIFFNELEEVICLRCRAGFERTAAGCPICSAPGEGKCLNCSQWETTEYAGVIDSGKSLYRYNHAMKEFLHQYKFLKDVVLSEVFASVLKEECSKQNSVIVPIPMNDVKLKERTFPQVDRLLDAASIPYTHCLGKNEVGLGEKSKSERMALQDVFWWNGQAVPEKILLFDDLYTTGSTMRLAAKVLKEKGAKEIKILTLIRA
ncbi:ComF family protein [Planococcus sp. 4-30]|uniref:ComF family protein n=1 Tax=Planococcus sp. 4-30 TaxID=2874583 RepID=UPI001CBD5499|nr:phosphoribosyltransferase family protein [Planococcus sp. 4-30]